MNTIHHLPANNYSELRFWQSGNRFNGKGHNSKHIIHTYGSISDFQGLLSLLRRIEKLVSNERAYFSEVSRFIVLVELSVLVSRATVTFRAYKRLFDNGSAQKLVVECDHSALACPIVLAANAAGLETYTLQHGSINDLEGYCPVLADKIFVWGEHYRNLLQKAGTPDADIVVTGSQIAEMPLPVEGDSEKVKIIFATNPYAADTRMQLFSAVQEAWRELDPKNYELVVKQHPSDDSVYGRPNQKVEAISGLSTLDSVPWCDVLLCHNTTIGIDAVRLGKLLIVLDVLERPLNEALQELVDRGGVIRVTNANELTVTLRDLQSGAEYISKIRQKGYQLSKEFVACCGLEAGRNAAKVIAN